MREFTKYGSMDLGDDTSTWLSKIQSQFEGQHADLIKAGAKTHLQFTYKDLLNGMAVGNITVAVHGSILIFPVIVRHAVLEDFDIFYDQIQRKWLFASDSNLARYVNSYSPFAGFEKDRIWSGGNTVDTSGFRDPEYDHRLKVASSNLADMARTISRHREILDDAPPAFVESLKELFKQASLDEIEIMSSDTMGPGVTPERLFDGWDVAFIKRADVNRYIVKLANRGINAQDPIEVTSDGVRALCLSMGMFSKQADKVLEQADQTGIAIERTPSSEAYIYNEKLDATPLHRQDDIGMPGTYEVVTDKGVPIRSVISPIMGWSGLQTGSWFLYNDACYALAGRFRGKKSTANEIMPRAPIEPGAKGVFYWDREGSVWVTPPVEISQIRTNSDGTLQILAIDLMDNGAKLNLVRSPVHKTPKLIMPAIAPDVIEPGMTNVFFPAELEFIPLPDQKVRTLDNADSVMKLSSVNRDFSLGAKFEIFKSAGLQPYRVYNRSADISRVGLFESGDAKDRPIMHGRYLKGGLPDVQFLLKTANLRIFDSILEQMTPGEMMEVYGVGFEQDGSSLSKTAMMRLHPEDFVMSKTASTTGAILGKSRLAMTQPADAYGDTRTNFLQVMASPAGLAARDASSMSNADLMAVIGELDAAHTAGTVKSLGLHPRISSPEYLAGLVTVAQSRGLTEKSASLNKIASDFAQKHPLKKQPTLEKNPMYPGDAPYPIDVVEVQPQHDIASAPIAPGPAVRTTDSPAVAELRRQFDPVKTAAVLTQAGRDRIKPRNFAIPREEAYPIHDMAHARNALARSAGKPEEATVRSKVYSKYPSLKKEGEAMVRLMAEMPDHLKVATIGRYFFDVEKVASPTIRGVLQNHPEDTIKTAADWNSKQALNDLFGLDLANKDTMSYFAGLAPAFETVEEALVKLLLVARLTPVGVEEELIRDTLEGVSTVKTKFGGLKAVFT